MADPITAGVVASSLMPTAGAAAASIPTLAGVGALAAPFAAAPVAAPALGVMPEFASLAMSGNPLVSAMGSGMAGNPFIGTSQIVSGMSNPASGGGFGQSILDSISAANKFMNQNPTTSQAGFGLAKDLMAPEQPMPYAPAGQVNRGQIQNTDYASLLNPQNKTVMRPPQISLLG
jgi:hypothetical protein